MTGSRARAALVVALMCVVALAPTARAGAPLSAAGVPAPESVSASGVPVFAGEAEFTQLLPPTCACEPCTCDAGKCPFTCSRTTTIGVPMESVEMEMITPSGERQTVTVQRPVGYKSYPDPTPTAFVSHAGVPDVGRAVKAVTRGASTSPVLSVGVYSASWASGTAVRGAPAGKTFVVTNRHVVEKPNGGRQVRTLEGEVFPATVLGTSATHDLALLLVDAELTAAPVADRDPAAGTSFVFQGNAVAGPGIHKKRFGRIAQTVGGNLWARLRGGPGDSGGGYLTEDGTLIGVLFGGQGQELSDDTIAVGAAKVRELIAQYANGAPSAVVTASASDCPGGVCRIGAGPSDGVVTSGGCASGSCGSAVTGASYRVTSGANYGASFGGACAAPASGLFGNAPVLRINGGPGVIRSVFGCR